MLHLSTLTKRSEYLAVAASGKRWVTPHFVVQIAADADQPKDSLRVGYTVTKKQGGAVVRNRIKRRLKEVAKQVMPSHARSGHAYVLIGRAAAAEAPFDELQRNLRWALRRLHNDKKPTEKPAS